MATKYTLKTKSVNSKTLFNEVSNFINDIIDGFGIIWDSDSQRDAIIEVIEEFMEDLQNDNKIEQWDIVCDARNNKQEDVKNKIVHLEIHYKQKNCLNITKLLYKIEEI